MSLIYPNLYNLRVGVVKEYNSKWHREDSTPKIKLNLVEK